MNEAIHPMLLRSKQPINLTRHRSPNTPFLSLFETIFTTTLPPHPLHLPFLIFLLALYLSLAYLTNATQGFYTYFFLDPVENSSGIVTGYCFGILAGVIVIFFAVWLMHWGRRRVVGGLRVKWSGKDFENRGVAAGQWVGGEGRRNIRKRC